MQILSLSFGRSADTPVVDQGIALALGPRGQHGHVILGACRVSSSLIGRDPTQLPRAVFLTASGGQGPCAHTINLVGERLVFAQDVQRIDDDLICAFRCELDVSAVLSGPYMLHGSLLGSLSATLWVAR